MWILKKLNDGTIKYLISEKKTYTLGRKSCDIVFENDPSVSRKHCTIYIAKQSECPFAVSTLTGVWVVDEQSKYGTYLKSNDDWVKINPGQNKVLNKGNIIRFGLMENVWSLEYKPVVACVSGIPTEQKKKIQSALQLIDGVLKNAWCKECSLVIVNEITLTVKVVLALINGTPIVTPNYLMKVVESIKHQLPLPSCGNFRPVIKEILLDKSLVLLDVKESRKELFKGKKFLVPTKKQLETLKEIITSAGGDIELVSFKEDWNKFAEENIVLIQPPFNNAGVPAELINSFKEISSFLKKNHKKRIIPESEIAQAVAYASTEKFCNPKNVWFNIRIGERKEVDLGPVIVEETPFVTEEPSQSSHGVVACSATINTELSEPANVESQVPHDIASSSQSTSQKYQNSEESSADRKRAHSPNLHDHEFQKKKARSETDVIEEQPSTDNFSIKDKNSQNKALEPESSQTEKNQTKSSFITNYFQKQDKLSDDKTSRLVRQNSNDFWSHDIISNNRMKRKITAETDDVRENSLTKRAKIPEENVSKERAETTKKQAEAREEAINSKKEVPFPHVRELANIQEENDLTDFFGKDRTNDVDDLNNTIFSLTLISPAFLKEDGSLIDPPSVPVNAKRFKKQKILSSEMLTSLPDDSELLSGEWIEPHSNRNNISVV